MAASSAVISVTSFIDLPSTFQATQISKCALCLHIFFLFLPLCGGFELVSQLTGFAGIRIGCLASFRVGTFGIDMIEK
jgi:hypothetical protein